MTASAEDPHIGVVVEGPGDSLALPILLRMWLQGRDDFRDVLGKPAICNGRERAIAKNGIERAEAGDDPVVVGGAGHRDVTVIGAVALPLRGERGRLGTADREEPEPGVVADALGAAPREHHAGVPPADQATSGHRHRRGKSRGGTTAVGDLLQAAGRTMITEVPSSESNALVPKLSAVTVALVTGTQGPEITHVRLGQEVGLTGHETSYANATDVHTLPKARLRHRRGMLHPAELMRLEEAVRAYLEL